jgi:type I restriction enzyme S subunit
MSEWKEFKLGDIVSVKHGYAFRGEYFSEIPTLDILLTPGNFNIGGGFRQGKLKYYNGDYPQSYILNEGDVIVTMTDLSKEGDTLGYSAKIPKHNGIRYLHNQRIGLLQFLSDNFSKDFIYWVLRSREYQKFIVNSATGSTVKHTSPSRICEYTFNSPDLPTQTVIAEILSSLDEKIELNNKINQELETLAQTLFKQWFIDFEFPNENGEPYKSSGGEMVDSELGVIPKGWEISSLDKIAEYLNGLALQKYPPENEYEFLPVIKIRELRQKDISNSDRASINLPEKYIIENGDVLFSWSGSLMVDFWTNGKGALNQHLFKVTSNLFPKWYYYLWTKHHLNEFIEIAESKATTMGHIQRQHLKDAHVLIPENNSIKDYSLVFEPIISKIIDNRIECSELIKMRDSLLPKLISGELEINEISN